MATVEGSNRSMAKFVSILTFDPSANEKRLEVRPSHREYLASLLEAGKLVISGPFADDKGALIMYEAADEAEARALAAADPYAAANVVLENSIREWKQVYPAG
jgi:uncharacterized protein YciI